METGDTFTLAISNGIWVENGYELLNSFTSALSAYYNASAENLDFAGDAEGSRETINSWVAESTMDKILDLIPSGMLSADTRVVLTNAVYFKASWQHPFDGHATSEGRFFLPDSSTAVVPMMTNTEHYRYASTEEWSAVTLDYAGGDASMLIILPSGDMEDFEENFSSETLDSVQSALLNRNVHLTMPRFEFTQSMLLSDILISLGMESAFGPDANFAGITGSPDLYISEVLHKAYVKVDEEGTEAAAATAVVMNMLCMPEPPVELNINRPFIFMVKDNLTGSIVFMGRVTDPTA
jgi:serpin B